MSEFKPECLKCPQFLKRYCIGTFKSEKGLLCYKKISNGSKYRSQLRSKREA